MVAKVAAELEDHEGRERDRADLLGFRSDEDDLAADTL